MMQIVLQVKFGIYHAFQLLETTESSETSKTCTIYVNKSSVSNINSIYSCIIF